MTKKNKKLASSKKIAFSLAAIMIPILLILILEVLLTVFNYGDDLSLFVSTPEEDSPTLGINLKIGQRYFYYYGDAFDPSPQKDLFLKEKPINGFRIFVLGASTAAGFPYGDNISFARFLQQRLIDAFPLKHIEVINSSITSVNSNTLLDFADEIIEQKPDLILIYAGHNEYYGPFGPASGVTLGRYPLLKSTILYLQKFKSFLLLRDLIGPTFRSWTKEIDIKGESADKTGLDKFFYQKTNIPYQGELFTYGLEQFENNMYTIAEKFKEENIPVILSELISNVKDLRPFPNLVKEDNKEALQIYKEGLQLQKAGKYQQAKEKFYLAKDMDPIRFRAPEDFNLTIHKIGNEFNFPVVPMKEYFEKASPNALVGYNIILEHVHPTVPGYFLMADAFYNTMKENKIVADNWPQIPEIIVQGYIHNWGFTKLDSLSAILVTANLTNSWPFNTNSLSSKWASDKILNSFPINTKVDSFALRTYKDVNYSVQSAHYDLAKYYEGIGETEKALNEYKALIYSIPTIDMFYEESINLLIKSEQYKPAIDLLQNGIKYNKSAFMFKWLGQSYLALKHAKDGIDNLRTSLNYDKNDNQVIKNLISAHFMIAEFKKGEDLIEQNKTQLNKEELESLYNLGSSSEQRHRKATDHIKMAYLHLNENKFSDAAKELQLSTTVFETADANNIMGMLMVKSEKNNLAINYFERSRQLTLEENPPLLASLAVAYLDDNQKNNAIYTFNILKENFPDYKDLSKLANHIKVTLEKPAN